jgi:ABC-2 type transport system ATP-binding protein
VFDVELRNVTKTYKVRKVTKFADYFTKSGDNLIRAVDDVSFTIKRGEFVALAGINGAGKSTLVKMMTGILLPTAGDVRIFGLPPHKNRRKINLQIAAVFGQRTQLRWDVSVAESYKLLKEMYGVSDADYRGTVENLGKLLGIAEYFDQPVRTLSLGQKMKAELGAALLHKPKILFLDEPTIGMDIFSKEKIIDFLVDLKQNEDITLILTTHDIDDMERICDRLILVEKGKVLVDDLMANTIEAVGHESNDLKSVFRHYYSISSDGHSDGQQNAAAAQPDSQPNTQQKE